MFTLTNNSCDSCVQVLYSRIKLNQMTSCSDREVVSEASSLRVRSHVYQECRMGKCTQCKCLSPVGILEGIWTHLRLNPVCHIVLEPRIEIKLHKLMNKCASEPIQRAGVRRNASHPLALPHHIYLRAPPSVISVGRCHQFVLTESSDNVSRVVQL